jgi:hypothetical protein
MNYEKDAIIPVWFSIDSNDRFSEDFRNKPFWKLPHDENGFNRLAGYLKNNTLHWKGRPVITLDEIASFKRKTEDDSVHEEDAWYCFFISNENEDNEHGVFVRQHPLLFVSVPITDAWIAIFINPSDPKYMVDVKSPPDDTTKETCAITCSFTVEIPNV